MNNPQLAPEAEALLNRAKRLSAIGGLGYEAHDFLDDITAYLGSTGAVAPERGSLLAATAYEVVCAYDDWSGHEPSTSVLARAIDVDLRAAIATHPAPADTGQGGRETVTVHHHPDNKPSPALDAIVSAAVQQFTAEPPWTMRLAHVEQRTAIERQASDLKGAIEALGGHPLLTDALRATDLTMRTLGKWHDAGEPGAALDAGART
jgi:hypothetical protein